eukprot:UN19984
MQTKSKNVHNYRFLPTLVDFYPFLSVQFCTKFHDTRLISASCELRYENWFGFKKVRTSLFYYRGHRFYSGSRGNVVKKCLRNLEEIRNELHD